MKNEIQPLKKWQLKLHQVIFGSDTFGGKLFDVVLIIIILLSVLAVMLDSVKEINLKYGEILYTIEWFFTILFSIEYVLRLISIRKPSRTFLAFLE